MPATSPGFSQMIFCAQAAVRSLSVDRKTISDLPGGTVRIDIRKAIHSRIKMIPMEDEVDIVVVGEIGALVEILGAALDWNRLRSAAARNQIGDFPSLESLVIVDVSRADDDLRM